MKVDELKHFLPRGRGVVLTVEKKSKSGIIIPGQADHDILTHVYKVYLMGPLVEDLAIGEEVYPMTAVLANLNIEDASENLFYVYCEDSFIKLHKVN